MLIVTLGVVISFNGPRIHKCGFTLELNWPKATTVENYSNCLTVKQWQLCPFPKFRCLVAEKSSTNDREKRERRVSHILHGLFPTMDQKERISMRLTMMHPSQLWWITPRPRKSLVSISWTLKVFDCFCCLCVETVFEIYYVPNSNSVHGSGTAVIQGTRLRLSQHLFLAGNRQQLNTSLVNGTDCATFFDFLPGKTKWLWQKKYRSKSKPCTWNWLRARWRVNEVT